MLVAQRYRLDEPLGRGSTADVWRATDQILDRPVAVKLLRADRPDPEAATDIERLRREARTAGRLNDAHVVTVYDFGSDDGRLHLVMELVDGHSLAQERAARGALEPWEAAGIVAQTASGLAAVHSLGVIHRDIKPANVMLAADRSVKITDFGIARLAGEAACSLTATGQIVGSAAYLAPERALGRPAEPASDVYSLGCVLYELLTGGPPFADTTALSVVRLHVEAAPVPPERRRPGIPVELSDYAMRMLAKDPALRPSAHEAARWLADRAHGEAVARPAAPAPGPCAVRDSAKTSPPSSARLNPTEKLSTVTRSHAAPRRSGSRRVLLAAAGVVVSAVVTTAGVTLSPDGGGSVSTPPPGTSAPAPAAPPAAEHSATDRHRGVGEPAERAAHRERKAAEEERKRQEKERDRRADEREDREKERRKAAERAGDGDD
ncbi:serine/threonine-protein kinase [Streptomyces sp. NPDC000983]|uniref:serine/threonine-protein kinase n=1 Tax=Streptomyces sp. NPDC000983 TaxID=3154373 RepID=UPI003324929F